MGTGPQANVKENLLEIAGWAGPGLQAGHHYKIACLWVELMGASKKDCLPSGHSCEHASSN